ncbi:MAG: PAS domain-containing protein, partial [Myxococcota bacterium]
MIDGIPALILVLSPSGEIERANRQALSHFGRTLEEIRDSITRDLIHPHDFARAAGAFAASISTGEALEMELRIRRSDGVYPWFQVRAHPLRGQGDQVELWYVLATDIDERKRVEDELRARELSGRLLVESMDSIPALAIVSNESGEIVFANRQVLSYYGRTLEEVKRWPTSVHIVHPDDLDHANQVVSDALSVGVACQDEYRLRRFDGVYRWFEGRYSPVKDQDGRITNWYVLLVDIDDRKRSEDDLRQSEAFLAEGQRLSATGSFHWRVATDEMIWSDQLYRIFEVDLGAPVTLELFGVRVHPDDIPMSDAIIDRARREGRNFESEHRLISQDGSVKFVHL